MKILAMDTSSVNATVCISDENKILGEYTVSNDRAHSQIIMPMLNDLLNNCSMTIKDIDVFAVAIGPGSFTGLRIGMAAMKTLAQSLSKPIIGASTLDEIAESFLFSDKIICPILDARRNEVYNAMYLNGEKIVSERVVDFDEILIELANKEIIFAGDATLKYRERIMSFNNPLWKIAPPSMSMQRSSSLASIALKRAINNDFDNLYDLSPLYLRLSQAEREYNLAHGL